MPAENLWLAAAWPPSRDGCVHGVGSGAGGEQRLRHPGTSPAWFAALASDGVTGYFFSKWKPGGICAPKCVDLTVGCRRCVYETPWVVRGELVSEGHLCRGCFGSTGAVPCPCTSVLSPVGRSQQCLPPAIPLPLVGRRCLPQESTKEAFFFCLKLAERSCACWVLVQEQ